MHALAFSVRLGDSFARTADNMKGLLPALFRDAGFEEVSETARLATLFGTLSLYKARKPSTAVAQGHAGGFSVRNYKVDRLKTEGC
jgi:hypothetical protein